VTADIAGASSGSVSGFMNMGNQIGAALTASLTPWIATRFGWTTSFLVAAGLCLIGAMSWLVVDPSRQLTVFTSDATPVQLQSAKRMSDQSGNRSPVADVSS
jgi:ACS family glucarate transporter-like MFS transporter